jgi:hypothetical protein
MLQCKISGPATSAILEDHRRSNERALSPRVHFLVGAVAAVFIFDCTARPSARNTVGVPFSEHQGFSKHQGSHARNSAFVIGRILRPRDGRVAETGP